MRKIVVAESVNGSLVMVDPGNPFNLIFSSPDAVERQRDVAERQRREIDGLLTRILLCTPSTSSEGGGSGPRFVIVLPQLAKDEQRRGRQGCLEPENLTQVQRPGGGAGKREKTKQLERERIHKKEEVLWEGMRMRKRTGNDNLT